MKALITTVPFGEIDRCPLELLQEANVDYVINPYNRKLTKKQLGELVSNFEIIIAGTEVISDKVMAQAPNLKLISRVGVGLDGVDLRAARENNITVSYTPEAPAPAVAELTVGLMLSLLRSVHVSNIQMHRGEWNRIFGRRISKVTIGLIGLGRIGERVARNLLSLGASTLLVNDIIPRCELNRELDINWISKEQIYEKADIISLHLPLTKSSKNLIEKEQLLQMKQDAILINTARGGIINEDHLYEVMMNGHLSGAALDVYDQEPNPGKIVEIDRCLLTAHMGSMTEDCRTRMEVEAVEEAIRFSKGEPLRNEVPEAEYDLQMSGR